MSTKGNRKLKVSTESDLFKKSAHFFYKKLLKPKSRNEDIKRREFIINIVLMSSVLISFSLSIVAVFDCLENGGSREGASVWLVIFIFLLFLILYLAARKGFLRFASFSLIALYYSAITYTVISWGVDSPQAILSYALVIVMSGVLINSRTSFFVMFVIIVTMFTVGNWQARGVLSVDAYWKKEGVLMEDIIGFTITLSIISLISWLSCREINKSLDRARQSEKELKKEKDFLEIRVEERTSELRKIQMEKISQLYRFAEFGKLSSGLFHDITNHLTALFLNLEDLETISDKRKMKSVRTDLKRVFNTKQKLEDFLEAIWKQLQDSETNEKFLLANEIEQVLQVMYYNACKNDVELVFEKKADILVFNNPVKFNKAISNLVMNAVDAYGKKIKDESGGDKRIVKVMLKKEKQEAVIKVQDWGEGISANMIKEVFNPFFSTKKSKTGAGIGLFSTKDVIENSFNGKITVDSSKEKGTIFMIRFKIIEEPSGDFKGA